MDVRNTLGQTPLEFAIANKYAALEAALICIGR